jgi:hypothetical protein
VGWKSAPTAMASRIGNGGLRLIMMASDLTLHLEDRTAQKLRVKTDVRLG